MVSLPVNSLEAAVHLIQVVLTPVFLLSGIAALLNVDAGRLSRVAGRLDHLSGDLAGGGKTAAMEVEIAALHWRSKLLDISVVRGAAGAVATCLSILTPVLIGIAAVGHRRCCYCCWAWR